jgi:hypothetical protein
MSNHIRESGQGVSARGDKRSLSLAALPMFITQYGPQETMPNPLRCFAKHVSGDSQLWKVWLRPVAGVLRCSVRTLARPPSISSRNSIR